MLIRRYIHSPFTVDHQGIKVSVAEDGKVTLTKEVIGTSEFDEIIVPASIIFKLAKMLTATRKIHWVEEDTIKS